MSDLNDFIENADENSIERTADGKGYGVNVKNKFIEHMTNSDKPECEYKRGDFIEKATFEHGDTHPKGTKGVIIGTLYEKTLGEAYLVIFGTTEFPVLTIKQKITPWKDQE